MIITLLWLLTLAPFSRLHTTSTTTFEQIPVHRDSSATLAALQSDLGKRGWRLDSVLFARDSFATVLVRRTSSAARILKSFRQTRVGFEEIGQPLNVSQLGVIPTVRWFSVTDSRTDALLYRFDAAVEGFAQSQVYNEVAGRWRLTYRDAPATCTPAELRRMDGKNVLIRFSDVNSPDCEAPCDMYVRETIGVEPAWAEILVWKKAQWVTSRTSDHDFSRHLASEYRRAAKLVRTEGLSSCRGEAGRMSNALETFARRAEGLLSP